MLDVKDSYDIFILGKSPIKWRQCPIMTIAVDWDVFILGKSPIKWRQRPDMTLAVDLDVKHQFERIQTEAGHI